VTEKSDSFYSYWGKTGFNPDETNIPTYHLLVYHCLDVAAVGQQIFLKAPHLLQKIIPEDFFVDEPDREQHFIGIISFLLALHDIGKFSDRFQNRKPNLMEILQGQANNRRYTTNHTEMGRLLFDKDLWKKIWSENLFSLDPDDDSIDWRDVWNPWFFAVTGHHGTPPAPLPEIPVSNLFEENDRMAAIQFTDACSRLFLKKTPGDHQVFSENILPAFSQKSWLLAGIAVLCDWIGSNADQFRYCPTPMPLEKYWNEYALPTADEAIQLFGIIPARVSPDTGMHTIFPKIFTPTPLQKFAETCEISSGSQLFIIEEATGSGKTEAALVLAHRMMTQGLGDGIYFGLPTMATANAMYDRMGNAYERLFSSASNPSLVLAHGGRHLSEKFRQSIGYPSTFKEPDLDGEIPASTYCNAWLSDNRKKALLAQVGVGTIDQALMAVLPLHHQSLRLLGLSRNILIVDEVHAYDSYVEHVLKNLLRFHAALGGSAILLSATLPQAQRQALIEAYSSGLGIQCGVVRQSDYPLVTHASREGHGEFPIPQCEMTHRTIEVECSDDTRLADNYLSETVAKGWCACWIRNTVDDAIETYQRLSLKFGEENVLLFHARFTMGDRLGIENKVLKFFGKDSPPEIRKGKILVATQVVEQSLDIDFDFMVTDLAPMDLVIQRVGRLHRHNRGARGNPRVFVLIPPFSEQPPGEWYKSKFPRAAYVYENEGQLWLTARLLTERKQITMPDDARLLIEGTFGPDVQQQIPETLIHQENIAEGKKMAGQAVAQLNILSLNAGYSHTTNPWQDDVRTPTRLGDARVTVLLLKWNGSSLDFFSSESRFSEDFSQVSISDKKISKEFSYGGELAAHLTRIKSKLADGGRWRILVPLEKNNDEWRGKARDRNDREVTLIYDSRIGLLVNKS